MAMPDKNVCWYCQQVTDEGTLHDFITRDYLHKSCSKILDIKTNDIEKGFNKHDLSKIRPLLLDPNVLENELKVLEYGASKYGKDNWKLGEVDRYVNALIRHVIALWRGEYFDKESGLPHTAHIRCNAGFIEFFKRGDPKNDL